MIKKASRSLRSKKAGGRNRRGEEGANWAEEGKV